MQPYESVVDTWWMYFKIVSAHINWYILILQVDFWEIVLLRCVKLACHLLNELFLLGITTSKSAQWAKSAQSANIGWPWKNPTGNGCQQSAYLAKETVFGQSILFDQNIKRDSKSQNMFGRTIVKQKAEHHLIVWRLLILGRPLI